MLVDDVWHLADLQVLTLTLEALRNVNNRTDRPQPKVFLDVRMLRHKLVRLFLNLGHFLAQLVGFVEARSGQQNLSNERPVWDHHLDRSKQVLQVDRELDSASVPRIHRDENSRFEVDTDLLLIDVDQFDLTADRILNLSDYLSNVVHHLYLHSVELVEENPAARRYNTLHVLEHL